VNRRCRISAGREKARNRHWLSMGSGPLTGESEGLILIALEPSDEGRLRVVVRRHRDLCTTRHLDESSQ
jgi:hypothetical protein